MGKGSGGGPSPDPQIGAAALKQAQTGEQWLDFAKTSYAGSQARQAKLDALTSKVTEQQLGIGKQQLGIADWQFQQAKEDRARWEKKGIAAQDAFAKEAESYSTPERQAEAAAEARGGVQTEAAAARAQSDRELAASGVAPGSGRSLAADRAGELGTAAASAGAANMARTAMRDKGLALKADVANMYAGLPAQSAAATQLGLGAGGSAAQIGANAVGMGQANQQIFNQSAQIMGQGFGGAMTGYAGQASTLSNLYGLQLQKYQIDQEAKSANISGIAGALGTGIGAFAALSSPKAKTKIKKVKKGEGLKAVKKMPVSTYKYKPGMGDSTPHVGTMSDKFAKATGQKDTGMIAHQDAIGITMAAVQDLAAKVDRLGKHIGIKDPTPRRSSQSPAKARAAQPAKSIKPAAKPKGLRGPDVKPAKAIGIGISRRA
jgi:hypothetical protein